VSLGGKDLPAAVNIGHRPTFGGSTRTIEAHVLDARLDCVPATARFSFVERLRPERRFASPDELKEHISADVDLARAVLGPRNRQGPASSP